MTATQIIIIAVVWCGIVVASIIAETTAATATTQHTEQIDHNIIPAAAVRGMEGSTKVLTLFCKDPSTRLYLIQQLTVLGIVRFHLNSCFDVRQSCDLIAIVVVGNRT